jgi:hypothetical protein
MYLPKSFSAFTYANLYAMIGNKDTIAWLTPHAAIIRKRGTAVRHWNQLDESCGLCFSADGQEMVALALSPEHLLEICDIVLRLLAVSVVHEVDIDNSWSADGALITAPALAYLMEQRESLKVLTLKVLEMDENHSRVLGDYSRPGLEIVLGSCRITDAGANALAEVLGRNQGPTKLDDCEVDNVVLANGLRGNSRLQSLSRHFSSGSEDGNREIFAIAGALRENKGLVELNLVCQGFRLSDETWGAICDSLETHPKLEILDLRSGGVLTPAELKFRIQALADMMKVNMSIHKIHLHTRYRQHELFRASVIPYLETNRLRLRVLAIQKNSLACVPCQGAGTSASCCSN